MKEYQRRSYLKHKARYREEFLQKAYGISQEVFERMLSEQNGVCKVCESDNGGKRLHIDHCHTKGHVRGLLCSNCNTALGLVKDNPNTLIKLINYLGNE